MCSAVEELRKEIDQLEEANEILRKEIKQFEDDSLSDIQSYRTTIDGQTSTVNKIKHKIEDVINEMNNKMQQLRDENEAKKDGISQEKAEVEKEIEQLTEQLEIVRQFEIDKDSIASEIRAKELAIEEKKKEFEESKNQTEKATKDLIERGQKANEDELVRFKENYYDELLSNTDPAILLHIQRRNNYENDLLSLQEMFKDYSEKIEAREQQNNKLRETIQSLKRDELIKRSADQRQNINTLKKEVAQSKQQLNEIIAKSKVTLEQNEKEREEEAKKMEKSLKDQQNNLDHKLQQIAALRELTLTVLSYRSQLEAEFITVLGEKIYEVAREMNPDQRIESRATRKLSMASSSASSMGSRMLTSKTKARNQISINHVLAQFTLEDRIDVLQRFMSRVHGEVDENTRADSPILNGDPSMPSKPSSV